MVETLTNNSDEILTIAEAAVICKVSVWAMYKRVKRNTVSAHFMGKRIYFLRSEIIEGVRNK